MTNPKKQIITKFNPDSYRDQNSKRILFKSLEFLNWNLFAFASRSLLWQTQVCFWYLFFGISSCLLPPAYCQRNNIDSLLARLNFTLNDTDRVNTLNILSSGYFAAIPDSACYYGQTAIGLAEKINYNKGKAGACDNLARYYWMTGNYAKALEYLSAKLEILKKLKDLQGLSATYGNIGIICSEQGDYPRALEYFFKSLKIAEELRNKIAVAKQLGNIGNIYRSQGEDTTALDYYSRALGIFEELGDKPGQAKTMGNIGMIYVKLADFTDALKYYSNALTIDEETGNKKEISRDLSRMGTLFVKQKDYAEAKEYYLKSLQIADEIGDRSNVTNLLGNIGCLLAETGNFPEAEKYLTRSLIVADEVGSWDHLQSAHQNLSNYYDTLAANRNTPVNKRGGFYHLALNHFKKFAAAKDSLFNTEKNKEMGKLEAKYEYEKQQAVAEAGYKKEMKVAAERAKLQRIIIYFFAAAALAAAVFAFIIFRSLRFTQEQKKIIERQKKVVDEKQNEILASIRYARRIQHAMMPPDKYLARVFTGTMKK